jgi:hypothetical protein
MAVSQLIAGPMRLADMEARHEAGETLSRDDVDILFAASRRVPPSYEARRSERDFFIIQYMNTYCADARN